MWVSDERYRAKFLELFERYVNEEDARTSKPKNNALVANIGELHRWLQVNGHDDRCQHMQPTDGGVQYGSEAEFG